MAAPVVAHSLVEHQPRAAWIMPREDNPVRAASETLFSFLRAATHRCHTPLENNLGLLRVPISKELVATALVGFSRFHRVWEAALARYPELDQTMRAKSRLCHVAHDLVALGKENRSHAEAHWAGVDSLFMSVEHAMGSVYVMQGSTLGGEIIARALRPLDWFPADGLHYFSPPGRDVRADWIELQRWADASWAPATWPAIAAGAAMTYACLEECLIASHDG